jgi:cyclopropane-fatty-acyl-phospholipid synthase
MFSFFPGAFPPRAHGLVMALESWGLPLVYRGLVPDFLVRAGIRSMLAATAAKQSARSPAERVQFTMDYVRDLRTRGLAESTQAANAQHYEVPAAFFEHVMGPHKKYSCGQWAPGTPPGAAGLPASEEAALALVCERAQLVDAPGFRVLDMGCGWGSFSLFCAARFPKASVVGVSNSASQRAYIMAQAAARGLSNLEIVTCDINKFEGAGGGFDRVVSIEMMEHVKNYEALLGRVAGWLKPAGKMFVHIFTHAHTPFHYTDGWVSRQGREA